jgi:phage-related tail protein
LKVERQIAEFRSLSEELPQAAQSTAVLRESLMEFPLEERRLPAKQMRPEIKKAHDNYVNAKQRVVHIQRRLRSLERQIQSRFDE